MPISRKNRLLILPALLAMAACDFPHMRAPDEEEQVAKSVRERHERNAYAIPPRNYPSQTNTHPLGWQPPPAPGEAPPQAMASAGAPAAGSALSGAPPAGMRQPPPGDKSPPMPGDKPQQAVAKSSAEAMGPNPPLPAGYVPSVPAPAGPQVAAAIPAAAMAPAAPGAWHAHLASHRSEEAAINDWQRRLKENPAVYGALEPDLLWVDIPNRGSYARLVFGSFASKAEAQTACVKISGPGRYCNAIQEKGADIAPEKP